MSDWISVDDKLPITEVDMQGKDYLDVEVIVATKHFVSTCYFEAGNVRDFWCQFKDYGRSVIHWQYLPAAPED